MRFSCKKRKRGGGEEVFRWKEKAEGTVEPSKLSEQPVVFVVARVMIAGE